MAKNSFPKGFKWGVATASYQIEGAWNIDGKGPSIWDEFCHRGEKVWNNHTGDVACDHYHRYKEDVALMRSLGIQAYRLSTSWPRIMPTGFGKVNAKGLAFYDKLVDTLLAAGIDPWITLFHWDLPLELENRGSWRNDEIIDQFAEYAAVVARKLGDRVSNWMTFNEPQCFIGLGYGNGGNGAHAPGEKHSYRDILKMYFNFHRAHGKGVQAIRANAKLKAKIGLAPCSGANIPASNSKADLEAARTATFANAAKNAFPSSSLILDPLFLGKYPEDALKLYGDEFPKFTSADMKLISQKLDFIGFNCYSGATIKAGKDGKPEVVPQRPGNPRGQLDWLSIEPDSLYWLARFFSERYGADKPVVITENGFCNLDWVSLDGKVHDQARIDQAHRYLKGLKRAASEGIKLGAYFHWSFMDNFEWAEGYRARFGMVHVDFETLKRTPKDSAYWYKDVIACNGENI